jgi:hypothetical protein
MFTIPDRPRFWWPVSVQVPADRPDAAGTLETQVLNLRFVMLPADEVERRARLVRDAGDGEEAVARAVEDVATAIVDWSDVVDGDGRPVPFDPATLRRMLMLPHLRAAVLRAYAQAMAGEAARKNG